MCGNSLDLAAVPPTINGTTLKPHLSCFDVRGTAPGISTGSDTFSYTYSWYSWHSRENIRRRRGNIQHQCVAIWMNLITNFGRWAAIWKCQLGSGSQALPLLRAHRLDSIPPAQLIPSCRERIFCLPLGLLSLVDTRRSSDKHRRRLSSTCIFRLGNHTNKTTTITLITTSFKISVACQRVEITVVQLTGFEGEIFSRETKEQTQDHHHNGFWSHFWTTKTWVLNTLC